jgi:hypothetical protein
MDRKPDTPRNRSGQSSGKNHEHHPVKTERSQGDGRRPVLGMPGLQGTDPADTGIMIEGNGRQMPYDQAYHYRRQGNVRPQERLRTGKSKKPTPWVSQPSAHSYQDCKREVGGDTETSTQNPGQHPVMHEGRRPGRYGIPCDKRYAEHATHREKS